VTAVLGKDGGLELEIPAFSPGSEVTEAWRDTACDILGLPPDKVNISAGAGPAPPSPACLSVNIAVLTDLVERACNLIKNRKFRESLPITVRRAYRPAMVKDDVGASYDSLVFSRPSLAAAVAEVEIDAVDYNPKIRGIWLCVEPGKVRSTVSAERTLRLLSLHALGCAFYEHVAYRDGKVACRPRDFSFYMENPPPIHIDIKAGTGKSGGIEELPFSTIPAALTQAVSQAMNYHFERLPIGAKDIWSSGVLNPYAFT
jgi:CO/xanthine dehydrogenase Mo-binding subunit